MQKTKTLLILGLFLLAIQYTTASIVCDNLTTLPGLGTNKTLTLAGGGINYFIGLGGADGSLGLYDQSGAKGTPETLYTLPNASYAASYILSTAYDSDCDYLYYSSRNGKFGYYDIWGDTNYDLTSTIPPDYGWTGNFVSALGLSKNDNGGTCAVFLGTNLGRLGLYDPYGEFGDAGTIHNYYNPLLNGGQIKSISVINRDPGHPSNPLIAYIGSYIGAPYVTNGETWYRIFFRYDLLTNTTTDLTSTIPWAYNYWPGLGMSSGGISTTAADQDNNLVYIGSAEGKFGYFNTTSNTSQQLGSVVGEIIKIVHDNNRGLLYIIYTNGGSNQIEQYNAGNTGSILVYNISSGNSNNFGNFPWAITAAYDEYLNDGTLYIAGNSGNFQRCQAASLNPTLNLTFLDEETGLPINETIDYLIRAPAGSIAGNTSNGTATHTITDGQDYDIIFTSENYTTRTFSFTTTNYTEYDITLYMLQKPHAYNVTVNVFDSSNRPLGAATVKIYRYDTTTNSYKLNQVVKTNDGGRTSASLVQNLVSYEFIIEYHNQTVYTSTPQYIYGDELYFYVTIPTPGFENYFNTQGLSGTLTHDLSTNITTFTYNDQANTATNGCIHSYTGTTLVNSSCLAGSSGTFTMHLPATAGKTYTITGTITNQYGEHTVDSINVSYAPTTPNGNDGILLMFLTMGVFAFIGLWNLKVSILLESITPFLFSITGLAGIGVGATAPLILLGLVIIYILGDTQ